MKLEKLAKELFRSNQIKEIGENLYYIQSEGIICNSKFLNTLNKNILNNVKEYNTDTSAQHPTDEGDDIVRAYAKDKYKN